MHKILETVLQGLGRDKQEAFVERRNAGVAERAAKLKEGAEAVSVDELAESLVVGLVPDSLVVESDRHEHLCMKMPSVPHAKPDTVQRVQDTMNVLGAMGWRLVGVDSPDGVQNCGYFFTRPGGGWWHAADQLRETLIDDIKRQIVDYEREAAENG